MAFTLVGFGFSAYLTSRELFSMHAICEWCVSSAVIMTVLTCLAVWRFLRGEAPPASATCGHGREPDAGAARRGLLAAAARTPPRLRGVRASTAAFGASHSIAKCVADSGAPASVVWSPECTAAQSASRARRTRHDRAERH